MQYIKDFEIESLGVEHSQYFQGYGVAFTKFEHCVTGIGDNATEAYDDAVEQMASGFSLANIESMPKRPAGIRKRDKVPAEQRSEESREIWFYVGIRFNLSAEFDPTADDGKRYSIVRYYAPTPGNRRGKRIIENNVTLGAAKAHCTDPKTSTSEYFDGYTAY